MRRTLTGLSLTAAAVLLTACGGSDDTGSDTPAATGTSASASETSAAAADSQFCTDAAAIQERIGSTLNDQSDPATLPQTLQEAAAEIRAVEPPAEIADDWNALADGVEQIGTAFGSIDFNDPDAVASFEQQVGQLQTDLSSASANVENYLREECGIETEPTEPAAPTS